MSLFPTLRLVLRRDADAWGVVEQEEVVLQCSMCQSATIGRRYKCISCQNLTLCVACYRCAVSLFPPLSISLTLGACSQVHDIHPLHAFLIIQDKAQDERERGRIEHEVIPPLPPDMNDEEALRHTGIKCFQCVLTPAHPSHDADCRYLAAACSRSSVRDTIARSASLSTYARTARRRGCRATWTRRTMGIIRLIS